MAGVWEKAAFCISAAIINGSQVAHLLGFASVGALCNGRRVCRLSVCPRQISKTKRDKHENCHLYRKSGSPSKNMTSDFAPEVAKFPQK